MNVIDRILNLIRGPLEAEIKGIAAAESVERSMQIDDIYRQLDQWAMAQMSSIYFACIYVEDTGELYALFSQDGRLFRSPVTISENVATIGALEEVQKVYQPISRFFVSRQANGDVRFAMIAATAVVNRMGEIDSTMLFDNMIKRAEQTGYYPKLDFYHLGSVNPAFDFGQFDLLVRDGVAYVASGIMDKDHPLANAILRHMDDGASYGASIEYYPIVGTQETIEVDGVKIRMYTDGINTRISLLPEQEAASRFTSIVTRSNDKMEQRQLDALRAALGDDELKKLLEKIGETNEQTRGMISRALGVEDAPTDAGAGSDTAAESTPTSDAEIVIDDETVNQIAAAVVRQLGEGALKTATEQISALSKAVEALTGENKKLRSDLSAVTSQQRSIAERLKEVEADDAAKRDQWVSDLPRSQRTVIVTHRPRVERQVEHRDETSDDIAGATLAAMPDPTKRSK